MAPCRTRALPLLFVMALALAPAARAQQTPALPGPAVSADPAALGELDGRALAEEPGTREYFTGGFVSGLPIGVYGPLAVFLRKERTGFATLAGVAGVAATAFRARRPVFLPPHAEQMLEERDPEYGRAFREAYARRVRDRRRGAAVLGGLLGTASGVGLLWFASSRGLD